MAYSIFFFVFDINCLAGNEVSYKIIMVYLFTKKNLQ